MKALVLKRWPKGYYLLPGKPEALARYMRSRAQGTGLKVKAGLVDIPPDPQIALGDLGTVLYLAEVESKPPRLIEVEFFPGEWGGYLHELPPSGSERGFSSLAEWETLAALAEQVM